jgi:ATP-dependent Clp protease adapter protein ClpS
MPATLTSDNLKAANFADGLFQDWLNELPEGALKQHVRQLAETFRELSTDNLYLFVEPGAYMVGCVKRDGMAELIGPYLKPACRGQEFGKLLLTAAMDLLLVRNKFIFVPASSPWMTGKLQAFGFHIARSSLPDATGDHHMLTVEVEEWAATQLRNVSEPRGRGPWSVVLHNDDVTPFAVVSAALERVLDVDELAASCFAKLVHFGGRATVRCCRSRWGAERLAQRIRNLASWESHALRVSVERV